MPNTDPRDRELAALYEVNAALREQLAAHMEGAERLADLEALADLQHKRMIEATRRWREATGQRDVSPDLGALLQWLMDERDNALAGELEARGDAAPWRAYVVQVNISYRIVCVVPSLRALLDQEGGRVRAFMPVEIIVTAYGRSGWVEEVPACRYSRNGEWLAAEEIADE